MINLQKEISLDDFLKTKFSLENFDEGFVVDWNNKTFFSQMLDVWGEMNYTHQAYSNGSDSSDVLKHLYSFHDVCCLVYNNPNVLSGEKYSLKIAEWEFINYILGKSKDKSCIKWFDQWNYDINFDFV